MDIEYSLLSPTEKETFLTLSEDLKTRSFVGFQSVSVTLPLYKKPTVTWVSHENAWPQVPNTLFPTLCPYPDLFGLSQWIQTSNLCKYFVVVEVSLAQIIVKKKKLPLVESDCMMEQVCCAIVLCQLPESLEESSTERNGGVVKER